MKSPSPRKPQTMADFMHDFPARLYETTRSLTREVPSPVATRRFVDSLTNLLFPIREKRDLSRAEMQVRWEGLQRDFLEIISPLCRDLDCCCNNLTERFFGEIPALYDSLLDDASVYEQSDPAARCVEEVILCYPGFYAVMVYRIAHIMYRLGVPILPRVITEYAHSRTGIDINPGARIGPHFYIDHGTGIVIGESTVIGSNVKIYQGVTLGATFVTKELCGQQRHPTIEDNVIIYAGSTILGGDTVVGHDTIIGGNVWLTESVPPYSTVYHKPEVFIKGNPQRSPEGERRLQNSVRKK